MKNSNIIQKEHIKSRRRRHERAHFLIISVLGCIILADLTAMLMGNSAINTFLIYMPLAMTWCFFVRRKLRRYYSPLVVGFIMHVEPGLNNDSPKVIPMHYNVMTSSMPLWMYVLMIPVLRDMRRMNKIRHVLMDYDAETGKAIIFLNQVVTEDMMNSIRMNRQLIYATDINTYPYSELYKKIKDEFKKPEDN